ncbi:GST [Lepeophtheirus salmonis]|uniref:GST n=2 Tax=Lepeophtheirus salmonis TaxID=72036 RepID=C1BVB4_LEPSM|nr:glutathione S-transferase 1-like [Lepeophtheirus salmonis]ACO12967.1 Glutathione S-transferase 1, isoform D [Lepeophtheirus salmonis]ADD38559.1 Glutathione S-transferase 1, isoform D [Lepeophtheirus salmonis]CAB4055392.1 GST [Lepeophtheirus salmonis]CAF2774276.1 GST [Lepeophtheirus salmonis]
MSVEIYGMDISAPHRIATMTAEVVGAPYEVKDVDIFNGGSKTPEFLELNPQHNIPVLKYKDFVMNESRAIAGFLASEFDKSGKLYPTCPMAHARVNQRLYFDMGVFYKAFGECVYPIMFANADVPAEKYDKLKEVLGWANDMVKETGFAAGTEEMTIADIAWVATYSSIKEADVIDLVPYKELDAWFTKCVALIPNYETCNGKGAKGFGDFYKSKRKE